jgi:hypothetical protein
MRAGKFRIYLSTAGRVFTGFEYASGGGSTRTSSDQAGGQNVQIARAINIGGNELTVTMPLEGGARHIGVGFNDNFGSCTAQVITGRPSGTSKIVAQSLSGGQRFEIFSIKTGGAACTIQDGNVLAQSAPKHLGGAVARSVPNALKPRRRHQCLSSFRDVKFAQRRAYFA